MNVEKFRYRYAEESRSSFVMGDESESLTEYEYRGRVDESKAIFDRIHHKIDACERESSTVADTLVLGVEDYVAVDAFIRYNSGGEASLESYFSEFDVVVVPGRMIHVPRPNREAVVDYLKEETA